MAPLVLIEDLHYAYPPPLPDQPPVAVLREVSLQIEAGQFVALIGQTGAGKSTLCKALNGVVPQSSGGVIRGTVMVDGLNTRQHPIAHLATKVGVVYEDPESQFFNMSVQDEIGFGLENLGIPATEIEERIDWALKVVGLTGYRERSPFELSGGEKQRVALAAAIAMRPKLLVLDEATTQLDPVGVRELFLAIQALREQYELTVLLVEQDSEHVAAYAQTVFVLEDGFLSYAGPPTQVYHDVYRCYEKGLHTPQLSEVAARLRAEGVVDALPLDVQEAARVLAGVGWPYGAGASAVDTPLAVAGAGVHQDAQPLIDVRDLSFNYPATNTGLRSVNLQLFEGEFVGLVGANGSGKTTLAKHFNGLLAPSAGHVFLEGREVNRLSRAHIAARVGYVFQNPDHQLFATTVREEIAFGLRNIGFGPAEVGQRTEEMIVLFGLEQFAEVPPAVLGYGIRRMIALAAVVGMQPRLIVLDEPTHGLDYHLTMKLMALLTALNERGHTIMLITHNMRLIARYCHRTLVMKEGALVWDGPTRTFFSQQKLLAECGIVAPPIIRLAQELAPRGMPVDFLEVDEFVASMLQPTV